MSTILHIEPAVSVSSTQTRVPISIETDGNRISGETVVTDAGHRVWTETSLARTEQVSVTIVSHKVDPNEEENSYAAISAELSKLRPLAIPMTTDDAETVAAVAHALITNGRSAW